MKWYKDIDRALKNEPETWIAYLYGQQLGNMPHLIETRSRYNGLFLQSFKFGYKLFRSWRPFNSSKGSKKVAYFVFASAANQIAALDSTVFSIKKKKAEIALFAIKQYISQREKMNGYTPVYLNSSDILKTLLLALLHGPKVYKELTHTNPIAAQCLLTEFLWTYGYLVYFQRVLSELKPDFVITSNDLNSSNRSMLAIANQLKIKTVYMQHASVSTTFPALRVDYAMLDGRNALNIYRLCEGNQPDINKQMPLPKILLTGQKKEITKTRIDNTKRVGIALNALDDFSTSISIIKKLSRMEHDLVIRWHPTQRIEDIENYKKAFSDIANVRLSDPKIEDVGSFLSCINILVAGNSSIHLEAALVGVIPIYYEFAHQHISDYYGYVKHGIATQAHSVQEINQLIENDITINAEGKFAIQDYSATYSTEWQGREGELVVKCLEAIYHGAKLPIEILEL